MGNTYYLHTIEICVCQKLWQSSNIEILAFHLIFPSRTSASTDKEQLANMYKHYHVWYRQNVVDVYGKTIVKLQRTSL